jgi:hypothetical protein
MRVLQTLVRLLNPSQLLQQINAYILGQPVSTWQVEMGWPDIHWLAWDKGGLVAAVLSLT